MQVNTFAVYVLRIKSNGKRCILTPQDHEISSSFLF